MSSSAPNMSDYAGPEFTRYRDAHKNYNGPGDSRPTAQQIIQDEGLEGIASTIHTSALPRHMTSLCLFPVKLSNKSNRQQQENGPTKPSSSPAAPQESALRLPALSPLLAPASS